MDDVALRMLLARINELERQAVRYRQAVVTDTSPLTVVLGGDDTEITDVKAVGGLALLEDDVVSVLQFGGDLIVLGRVSDGGRLITTGISGSRTGVTSTTMAELTSGPTITVPADGAYIIGIQLTMALTGSGVTGLRGAVAINGTVQGTTGNEQCYHVATAQNGGGRCREEITRDLAAGDVLSIYCAPTVALASTFVNGRLDLRPAR